MTFGTTLVPLTTMLMKLMDMKQPLTHDTFWRIQVTLHDCEVRSKLQQCYLYTSHLLKNPFHYSGMERWCVMYYIDEWCKVTKLLQGCAYTITLTGHINLNTSLHSVHPTYDMMLKPSVWTNKFQQWNNHQQEMISLPKLKKFTVVEEKPQLCFHHHKIF